MERLCTKCQSNKDVSKFKAKSTICYCCAYALIKADPEKLAKMRKTQHIAQKKYDKRNRARRCVNVSKLHDKDRGFEITSDYVTKEFVIDLFKSGCQYCGETKESSMGIDRIDNDKPHTVDNCIACCTRCNFIRRHMPYEAWLLVAPGVKAARLSGAFGNWIGHKGKKE